MKQYAAAFILASIFLAVGVGTLGAYGINWDSPGRFLRGQAYLDVFFAGTWHDATRSGTPRLSPMLIAPEQYASRYTFSAFEFGDTRVVLPDRPLLRAEFDTLRAGKQMSFYQHPAWDARQFSRVFGSGGHPPLPDILAAIGNRVFYQDFGLMGDIEGYTLASIVIAAAGVALVTLFIWEITGSLFAAVIGGLSLGLFPYYVGESHINLKDPAQAVFFTISIWAFWHFVRSNKMHWFWVWAASVALAVGVKWNIIFLPCILVPWLIVLRKSEVFLRWWKPIRFAIALLVVGAGSMLFIVAIWPDLWVDPVRRLWTVAAFYWETGVGMDRIQPGNFILPFGFNLYPLLLVMTQTPLIVLFLAIIGLLRGRADRLKTGYLLALWVLVPILRVSLPHMRLYGGIRQFMELLPAIAVLSGVGAAKVVAWAKGSWRTMVKICITIPYVILVYVLIVLHPNQNVFFNSLAGGLRGASSHNLIDWTLTYGNVYKQAALWLNANAPADANVAILDGPTFALSPLWLRPDISISPDHFSGFDGRGEYLLVLPNPLNPQVFAYQYPARFLRPVAEITVDGVTLLSIYKNDPKYLTHAFGPFERIVDVNVRHNGDVASDWWEIDLGRDVAVTRIAADGAPGVCLWKQGDFIGFVREEDADKRIDNRRLYVLNERQEQGAGRIVFTFPGERARYIRIFPQSALSCFARGKVAWIEYMKE